MMEKSGVFFKYPAKNSYLLLISNSNMYTFEGIKIKISIGIAKVQ